MIKIRKLIKILIKTIVAIFLIGFFVVCILLGILHVKATQSLGAAKFEQELLEISGCYICRSYPPSKDWIECSRLKEAWKYLDNEKVQKILFCDADYGDANLSPDNWGGWEIVGQEKINQILELLRNAKKGNNESIIWMGMMKIITDKHKFIIPIHWNDQGVYGIEWTSYELRKQFWKWGFPPNTECNYEFPPKYKVVAILLYSNPKFMPPPLALFGNKKEAEELIFNPLIKEYPTGIKGIVSLYKFMRTIKFGVESKKENGKIIAGNELKPEKIIESREWLEKIMDAYDIALKEAESREKYFPMKLGNPVGRIVFMTQEKDYWKEIGIDANTVYDDYIKSEQLKAYFDELGLTKELLSSK